MRRGLPYRETMPMLGAPTGAVLRSVAWLAVLTITVAGSGGIRPVIESTVDVTVPVRPVVLKVGGEARVVYELHVTNIRPGPIELSRLLVLAGRSDRVLGELSGADLARALGRRQAASGASHPQRVEPGRRVVVYLWLPSSTIPHARSRIGSTSTSWRTPRADGWRSRSRRFHSRAAR